MKKNLLLAVLTVIGMITTAQVNASELNLSMFDKSPIAVSIDNGPLTAPASIINFKKLPEGYHKIAVFSTRTYPGNFGNNYPVFCEQVYIPAMVEMNAAINRFGKFKVHSLIPKNHHASVYNPTVPVNNCGYNPGYVPQPYYNHCGNGNNMMGFNNSDFDQLRYTIEQQNFDQTRLTVAKQAIQNRMLNTNQVAELMRLFSFESTKLDFAKYAYDRTIDKDRYFMINNEFSFSSTIDELINYINRG